MIKYELTRKVGYGSIRSYLSDQVVYLSTQPTIFAPPLDRARKGRHVDRYITWSKHKNTAFKRCF